MTTYLQRLYRTSESGRVSTWVDDDHYCRALVDDNGKIISTLDCWYQKHPTSSQPQHWEALKESADKRSVIVVNGNLHLAAPNASGVNTFVLPVGTGDTNGRFEVQRRV